MSPLPTPFRAVLGLVATAMDEAKHLPDRAIELPMLAVSTALQVSLRAQQRYAHLAARGDEFLARRETTDDPPEWARFDEPLGKQYVGGGASADDGEAGDVTNLGQWDADDGSGATASAAARPAEGLAAVPDPEQPQRKTVRKPRNGKPSAFDAIGDD